MSKQDFRLAESQIVSVHRYRTKAGSAIKAGELCIQGVSGDEKYAKVAVDASDTDDIWIGLAASNDTATASADGYIDIYDDPDAVLIGKATTSANLTDAILNTKVTLDVASSVQTVDENDTTKGCLCVIDYDTSRGEVLFKLKKSVHIHA